MNTMLTIACLLVLGTLGSGDTLPDGLQALKFAADNKDSYISFVPGAAFSQITHKASVCAWLKNPGASNYNTVFDYNGANLRLSGKGSLNCVAGPHICFPSTLPSSVTAVLAEWHHVCLTFSAASNMARYYVNGEQVDSKSVPTTISYGTSYKVTVGNYSPGYTNGYYGGELTDLNVYAKTLSAEEVQEKYKAGMCSLERDSQEDSKVLSWGDILKKPRHGTVTEFIPTVRQCEVQVPVLKAEIEELRDQETTQNKKIEDLRDQANKQNQTIEELRDQVTTLKETTEDLIEEVTTLRKCQKKCRLKEGGKKKGMPEV